MGEVTDKFREICNKMDALPNFPVSWLPELYAITSELERSISIDGNGMKCSRLSMERFIDKFKAFQKKYLGINKPLLKK